MQSNRALGQKKVNVQKCKSPWTKSIKSIMDHWKKKKKKGKENNNTTTWYIPKMYSEEICKKKKWLKIQKIRKLELNNTLK